MSAIDRLKEAGLRIPESLKKQARIRTKELKTNRRGLEVLIHKFVIAHRNPQTGKWDSPEAKEHFKRLIVRHTKLHQKIVVLGGERKAPEYDPY